MFCKTKSHKGMMAALLTTCLTAGASFQVQALESVHFLIPGGAGGGWDGTARGTGEALSKSGLVDSISYENMSGGGGGKAIAHLIETAGQNKDTLMVNSTPIVIRSLSKVFPQSFRDLTPVAATIGDFGAFVVKKDSKYTSFTEIVAEYKENPRSIKIAGGSARGSMDHLVAAMAFKAAGGDARQVRYVAYDAGGKAMAGLLSGETQLLSTGFSEALALAEAGEVRILVMTGSERNEAAPEVPTLKELGYDATFVNWRGFFAAPGISDANKAEFVSTLEKMYDTPEWETVRSRNGWTEIFKPDAEFVSFLEDQEKEVGSLMRELGFLK
ncbi:MAG: tripartite tricarboxylate transporter substrate binding protein [Neptuniibacter sp.]